MSLPLFLIPSDGVTEECRTPSFLNYCTSLAPRAPLARSSVGRSSPSLPPSSLMMVSHGADPDFKSNMDAEAEDNTTAEELQLQIDELEGSALEWACVDAESAAIKSRKAKTFIFCGAKYTGGPFNIRLHLDEKIKPRNVRACVPRPEHRAAYLQVLKELRKRQVAADQAMAKANELKAKQAEGAAIVASPAHAFQSGHGPSRIGYTPRRGTGWGIALWRGL